MSVKIKVVMVLTLSLFLLSIMTVGIPVKADDSNRIPMINIMAKGLDEDIPGPIGTSTYMAETLIVGKIEFDPVSNMPLGQVEFHLTIYDDSGKKIYSMKGHLENGVAIPGVPNYCPVRNVTWINLWLVMGVGKIKTSDTLIENFEYRGNVITLPNTEGKYVPANIVMLVSPDGEYVGGYWESGWAWAGIMGLTGNFGGIAYLTKFIEHLVL